MLNDRLVDQLAADLKPVRRRSITRDILILAAVCGIELVMFLSMGFLGMRMMRPDMPMAMGLAAFWWKLCSLGMIAVVGAGVAVFSFDPARSPRTGLRWLGGLVALCLAAGWLIDAARSGWPALLQRLDWPGGLHCVAQMVVLSIPPVIGLGLLMRHGAATDTAGSALAVGIAAAAWGAFVFVFACPYDDPLYIAVWYLVGCGFVTALARMVLPRLTRW